VKTPKKLTEEIANVLGEFATADNLPGPLFAKVIEFPVLNADHVAQLRRLAAHLELCIHARNAWRGE